MNNGSKFTKADHTYILAGYTVPCNGTVTAWEFCYKTSNTASVTFYPGIWRINETNNKRKNINYFLVRSNNVTYSPKTVECQTFNLSVSDQFIASAGSVIGLYVNKGAQLLLIKEDKSMATYEFKENQSSVNADINPIKANISLKVHLGKTMYIRSYKKNPYYNYMYTCIYNTMLQLYA